MQVLELSYPAWERGLLEHLNAMRLSQEMCDVRLLLSNDEVLLAHSCLLAATSPFLKSILHDAADAEIDLREFPVEMIRHVLDFIYTGQTQVKMSSLELFHQVVDGLQLTILSELMTEVSKDYPVNEHVGNSFCDIDLKHTLDALMSEPKTKQKTSKAVRALRHHKPRIASQIGTANSDIRTDSKYRVPIIKGNQECKDLQSSSITEELDTKLVTKEIISQEVDKSFPEMQGPPTDTVFYRIEDAQAVASTSPHARHTLPDILMLTTEGNSVYLSTTVVLAQNFLFGPMLGHVLKEFDATENIKNVWKVTDDDGSSHWIDCRDETKSNWLRYVEISDEDNQPNLEPFQHENLLYFRTLCEIQAGTRLFVRNPEQTEPVKFEMEVNVNNEEDMEDVPHICVHCNMAYASDIVYYKHMWKMHDQPIPIEIYHKIQTDRMNHAPPIASSSNDCDENDAIVGAIFRNMSSEREESLDGGENNKENKEFESSLNSNPLPNHGICDGDDLEKLDSTIEEGKSTQRPTRKSVIHKLVKVEPVSDEECIEETNYIAKTSKRTVKSSVHTKRKKTNEINHVCTTCQRGFRTMASLKQHEDIHVNIKPYSCPKCGKQFVKKQMCDSHIARHDQVRQFQCTTCGRDFSSKHNMEVHMRKHTGIRPFQCDICSRAFMDPGNLMRHKRIHTGEKPYKCTTCCRSFTQAGHLREHLRQHTGDKPHKCSYCGIGFTSAGNLRTHTRKHTKEKPFICKICGRGYRDASYLKCHMRLHSGEKPYVCVDCGEAFSANSRMRIHQRRVHNASLIRTASVQHEGSNE